MMHPSKRLIRRSAVSLIFGLVFLLCGITQIVAGVTFLTVFKKILMTASNIWIGILNFTLGLLWITLAEKKILGINIGLCLSLTFINLGNLLLMELGEWRAFFPANLLMSFIKDGRLTILKAAYLSTMIPTVIAFIVALLASQYIFTLIIVRRKKEKVSVPNFSKLRESTIMVPRHFKWVFNEQQKGWENELQLCTAPSSPLSDIPVLEESPTHIVTFRSSLCFLPDNENQDGLNFDEEPELCRNEQDGRPEASPLPICVPTTPIDLENPNGKPIPTLFKIATIRRHPFNVQFLGALPDGIPYETENPGNLQDNNKSIPPSPHATCPALAISSPSLSAIQSERDSQLKRDSLGIFDVDSLVHLTEMELLARQWRFQNQHKALERKVSLRLAKSQKK